VEEDRFEKSDFLNGPGHNLFNRKEWFSSARSNLSAHTTQMILWKALIVSGRAVFGPAFHTGTWLCKDSGAPWSYEYI